jgi:hypothetical protein
MATLPNDEYPEAISGLIGLPRESQSDLIDVDNMDTSDAPTSSSVNQTTHPTNPPSATLEEIDMKSFISPYQNKPYYACIPKSSFASSNASPRPVYDIVRDTLTQADKDHFIAEIVYLLVRTFLQGDDEDRPSNKVFGVKLPQFMKRCIDYLENLNQINGCHVS